MTHVDELLFYCVFFLRKWCSLVVGPVLGCTLAFVIMTVLLLLRVQAEMFRTHIIGSSGFEGDLCAEHRSSSKPSYMPHTLHYSTIQYVYIYV